MSSNYCWVFTLTGLGPGADASVLITALMEVTVHVEKKPSKNVARAMVKLGMQKHKHRHVCGMLGGFLEQLMLE